MNHKKLRQLKSVAATLLPLMSNPASASDGIAASHSQQTTPAAADKSPSNLRPMKGSLFFENGMAANPTLYATFPSPYGRENDKAAVNFTPYPAELNLGMVSETQISFSTVEGANISCRLVETQPGQFSASATTKIGDDIQTTEIKVDDMLRLRVAMRFQDLLFKQNELPMNAARSIMVGPMDNFWVSSISKCLEVAPKVPEHNDPAPDNDRHGTIIHRSGTYQPAAPGDDDMMYKMYRIGLAG